jgi:hypothetical protein
VQPPLSLRQLEELRQLYHDHSYKRDRQRGVPAEVMPKVLLALFPALSDRFVVKQVCRAFDVDGDGMVSFDEYVRGAARLTGSPGGGGGLYGGPAVSSMDFIFRIFDAGVSSTGEGNGGGGGSDIEGYSGCIPRSAMLQLMLEGQAELVKAVDVCDDIVYSMMDKAEAEAAQKAEEKAEAKAEEKAEAKAVVGAEAGAGASAAEPAGAEGEGEAAPQAAEPPTPTLRPAVSGKARVPAAQFAQALSEEPKLFDMCWWALPTCRSVLEMQVGAARPPAQHTQHALALLDTLTTNGRGAQAVEMLLWRFKTFNAGAVLSLLQAEAGRPEGLAAPVGESEFVRLCMRDLLCDPTLPGGTPTVPKRGISSRALAGAAGAAGAAAGAAGAAGVCAGVGNTTPTGELLHLIYEAHRPTAKADGEVVGAGGSGAGPGSCSEPGLLELAMALATAAHNAEQHTLLQSRAWARARNAQNAGRAKSGGAGAGGGSSAAGPTESDGPAGSSAAAAPASAGPPAGKRGQGQPPPGSGGGLATGPTSSPALPRRIARAAGLDFDPTNPVWVPAEKERRCAKLDEAERKRWCEQIIVANMNVDGDEFVSYQEVTQV